MLELAGVGAKVLQIRSVGLAMRENMALHVLSAFEDCPARDIVAELSGDRNGEKPHRGHRRRPERGPDDADQRGRQARHGRASDQPAGRRGHCLRHDRPRGDTDTGSCDLTFTVPRASLAQAMAVIEKRKDEIGYRRPVHDDAVAKVSIVGVGIRSNPAARGQDVRDSRGTAINLLAVIDQRDQGQCPDRGGRLELAVRVLHTAFGLDAEERGMSGEGLIAEPRAVHRPASATLGSAS